MKEKLYEYYAQFKSNKLFKQTMKSYFGIACLVFCAYAIVIVVGVSRAAVSQMITAEQKMLTQAENTSDSILRNINASATYIFEDSKVAQDAMTKPYDPVTSIELSDVISSMKNRSDAIYKVYFFNLKDDYIYTGENPVYHISNFPDSELLNIIASTGRYTVNRPHVLRYEDGNTQKEERTLLSLYKYSDTSCMAVFISSDYFNNMVNAGNEQDDQSMMILHSDGIVLSSTDSSLFGQDLSEDKVVKELINSDTQDGYIKSKGEIYCYRKSNTLNSLYACSFKESSVIVSYGWQFATVILFAILLLLLYFLSSIKMSMSIFRPFKKLRSDVFNILGISYDLENDEGTERDLKLISENLVNIKEEYDSMQETEHLYSVSKRNELVYSIMTGSYNFDSKDLEEYNILLMHPYNTILIMRIDNTKSIERTNINLIQYGIANAGTELMTRDGMAAYYTTYCDEYDIIFLINHKAPEFDTSLVSLLQKYTQTAFSATASAAFDTVCGNVESVVQTYRNAKYAMQYRLVRGHNCLIEYNDLIASIDKNYEYPAKIEKAIIREINLKNKESLSSEVDNFINCISSMPYMYIIVHSCLLIMTIDAHIKSDKLNEESQSNVISDDLVKAETIDDIRNMIMSKCNDALITSSDIKIDDKHLMIANTIEEYIDNHYTDPNLSIDVIAAYVNKSANYTRSIFKQNKGISISDYITKKRFDEVCRLLTETNLTAQAISQKIGMSSGSYFYTAFKKYTGYTPEQFRKKHLLHID